MSQYCANSSSAAWWLGDQKCRAGTEGGLQCGCSQSGYTTLLYLVCRFFNCSQIFSRCNYDQEMAGFFPTSRKCMMFLLFLAYFALHVLVVLLLVYGALHIIKQRNSGQLQPGKQETPAAATDEEIEEELSPASAASASSPQFWDRTLGGYNMRLVVSGLVIIWLCLVCAYFVFYVVFYKTQYGVGHYSALTNVLLSLPMYAFLGLVAYVFIATFK